MNWKKGEYEQANALTVRSDSDIEQLQKIASLKGSLGLEKAIRCLGMSLN